METAKQKRIAWADASVALCDEVYHEEDDDHHELLRANNFGWAIGVDEDYCGHTHAVSGQRVGEHLVDDMCVDVSVKQRVRFRTLPSTDRLAGHGPEGSAFEVEPEQPAPSEIEKGDLVTTGTGKPWGTHIRMALTEPDEDGFFETVEGNTTGRRGDGSYGRGVVRKRCNISEVARVYRFGEAQFDG